MLVQVQDLKRHANLCSLQMRGSHPRTKCHDIALRHSGVEALHPDRVTTLAVPPAKATFIGPAPSQVRIAIELAFGRGGKTLSDFPRRCQTAREQGAAIPHFRTSEDTCRRVWLAAAEVLFDEDRELLASGSISEASWAQDKRKNLLLMKAKYLTVDWKRRSRMIDALDCQGDTGLGLAREVKRALETLCTRTGCNSPDSTLISAAQAVFRNACADGEFAEQNCFRFVKDLQ